VARALDPKGSAELVERSPGDPHQSNTRCLVKARLIV
jgi:hypothetical protein